VCKGEIQFDRRHSHLKITTEAIGDRQLSLTIEVDEERVERARRQTARQISREVDIPGFRKGKAPYSVVVQRFGEGVVRQELVANLAEDAYREALSEEEIVPYAPGTLEETSFEPLTLRFTIPLAPEVDLGQYRDYRLEPTEVEVPSDALDEALEAIREQNAVLAPVERPAAEGDLLVAELTGRMGDGSPFLHEEEARLVLDRDQEAGLPGLIDALIGLEEGEERAFQLVLPEDFQVEELAGEEAAFEVSVQSVYERILPELDDDLARTVGNYDSFDELVASVRQQLRESRRAQAEAEYAEQVLQDIIDQAEVSYPPLMLDEALDDAVENYEREIERREHMMLEDYLRIQGKSMDDLREELQPQVEASLVRSLVLGEIVEKEDLEVSDEALDSQIVESSERYGERSDEVRASLSAPEGRRSLRNRMLANKALERLVAIAKGEAGEASDSADQEIDTETEDAEDGEEEKSQA
jgi:trigger factor